MKLLAGGTVFLFVFISTFVGGQSIEQLSFFEDYEYRPRQDEIVIVDDAMYIAFRDLSNHITVLQVKDDTMDLFYRTERICEQDYYLDWKLSKKGLIICHKTEIIIEDIFNNSTKVIPLSEPLESGLNKNYIDIDGPFINIIDQDQILSIDGNSLEPFPFLTPPFLYETDQFYYAIEEKSRILQIDKTTHNQTIVRENVQYWHKNYFGINDSLFLIDEPDTIKYVMQVPADHVDITITNEHITFAKRTELIYSVHIHDKVSGGFIDSMYIEHENQYILKILGSDQTKIYYRERKNSGSNFGKGAVYNLESHSTKYLTESIQFGVYNLLFFDSIMIFESWQPEASTYVYNGNKDTLISFYLEPDLTNDDRNFQFWRFNGNIYMRKFEPKSGLQIYKYSASSDDFTPIHQNYLYPNGIGNTLTGFRNNFALLSLPLGNERIRYADTSGTVYESPIFKNLVHHAGWVGNEYYYFGSDQTPDSSDTISISLIKYDPVNGTESILEGDITYNQNVAPVNQLKTYIYGTTLFTNLEKDNEYFLYATASGSSHYINKDALDIIQRVRSQNNQVLFAPFKGLKTLDLSNLTTTELSDQNIENIYSNSNRTIAIGTDSIWYIEENEIKWRRSLDVNRQTRVSFITQDMFILYRLYSTNEAICYSNNGVEKFRIPEGEFSSFDNYVYTKYRDNLTQQFVIDVYDSNGNFLNSTRFNSYPTFLTRKDDNLHYVSNDQIVRKFTKDLILLDENDVDFVLNSTFIFPMSTPYSKFKYLISFYDAYVVMHKYDHNNLSFEQVIGCEDDLQYQAFTYFNGTLFLNLGSSDYGYQLYKLNLEQSPSRITSIEDLVIKVYPNPTKDILHISQADPKSIYTIYDLGGKIVARGLMDYDGIIQVNDLNDGLYVINYLNKGIIQSSKFVKLN